MIKVGVNLIRPTPSHDRNLHIIRVQIFEQISPGPSYAPCHQTFTIIDFLEKKRALLEYIEQFHNYGEKSLLFQPRPQMCKSDVSLRPIQRRREARKDLKRACVGNESCMTTCTGGPQSAFLCRRFHHSLSFCQYHVERNMSLTFLKGVQF